MPKPKRTSFFEDPIAYEAEEKERAIYLAHLFVPIVHYTKDIEMDWLVPGLIPRGYLAMLAADPKEGKTCLATALALAVACGTPFAGMPTKQAAVLWLSLEEGPHERRYLMRQSALNDPATPFYTCHSHIAIDTDEGIDSLNHWITEAEAGLIVVDPLHGAHSGRSLMEGWAARRTLKMLKELCVSRNVAALVLHHAKMPSRTSRFKRVAENAQLSAVASMEMILTHRPLTNLETDRIPESARSPMRQRSNANLNPSANRQPPTANSNLNPSANCQLPTANSAARLITLHCRGRGHFANQTLYLVSRGPLDYMRLDSPELPDQPEQKPSPAQAEILELLKTGSRRSTHLLDELHIQPGTLRNALTALRRMGLVRVVWRRGEIRRYGLTDKAKTERESPDSHGDNESPDSCLKEKDVAIQ